MAHKQAATLAAITMTMDPTRDFSIRVLEPGATGVKNLASRDVQDYERALEIIKAAYPTAQVVEPHALDEEVYRRQPPVQPGLVIADYLMEVEF